jgi:hypothetical protein
MEQIAVDENVMVDKYIPNWPAQDASLRARNQLRLQYRPDRLRVLFIGEAPPASGKFFYQRDSGLYRAFREAFQLADPSITDANFLHVFQTAGCYLVDLCGYPVDQLSRASRRVACMDGEMALGQTLKTLQPKTIVTVLYSIRDNVDRVVARANWKGQRLDLPYPGRWKRHREVFLAQLVPLLRSETLAYLPRPLTMSSKKRP